MLNLYPIKECNGNVLTAFNEIFAQLHGVLKNYIRGKEAMKDCLKAIEVSTGLPISILFDGFFHCMILFVFFSSSIRSGELPSKWDIKIENRTNHSFPVWQRYCHRRKHILMAWWAGWRQRMDSKLIKKADWMVESSERRRIIRRWWWWRRWLMCDWWVCDRGKWCGTA